MKQFNYTRYYKHNGRRNGLLMCPCCHKWQPGLGCDEGRRCSGRGCGCWLQRRDDKLFVEEVTERAV